ncbi:MAG: phosphatidate cytidylyltransferase [Anaerolineales bacterium]|nr:phosphatidate cytidylyltransferase [Anaerolineales bacterium]
MLTQRVLVAVVLAAIGIPVIVLGGIPYFVLFSLFLCIAAWEYAQLFRQVGFAPSNLLVVLGTAALLVTRAYFPDYATAALAVFILTAITWHLVSFEGGRDQAATDFAITLGGVLYLGWIGAYLIDLRNLPNGMWWFWLVLPSVWLADTAAYFFGKAFGRHPLSPRLSPKKTWEGYWAGVLIGTIGTAGLALLWNRVGGLDVTWYHGGILGLILSILPTLGDLGESMIKRQAGQKDSGTFLPGHGGAFDRFDSWLWAGVIGFYLISWFLI